MAGSEKEHEVGCHNSIHSNISVGVYICFKVSLESPMLWRSNLAIGHKK